ncbi:MAG: hypothetical protein OSB62_04670 [Alphaproteobacteria bacterium]|jgi:hypothetical protein|nr:hypothetical protein [Alphaproteobacteria bacterium]
MVPTLSYKGLKRKLHESGQDSVYFIDIRHLILKDEHPSNPSVMKLHMRMGPVATRVLDEMLNLRKSYHVYFNETDNLHTSTQQCIVEANALDIEDVLVSLGAEIQQIDGSDYLYVKKMHMVNIAPIRGIFFNTSTNIEVETIDKNTHMYEAGQHTLLIQRDGMLDVRDLSAKAEFKSTRFLIYGDPMLTHLGGCVQVSYHEFSSTNVMGDLLPCGMSTHGDLIPLAGPNPRTFACPSMNELQQILQRLNVEAA